MILNIDIHKDTLKEYIKMKLQSSRNATTFWKILKKKLVNDIYKCKIEFYWVTN